MRRYHYVRNEIAANRFSMKWIGTEFMIRANTRSQTHLSDGVNPYQSEGSAQSDPKGVLDLLELQFRVTMTIIDLLLN
jgi:hypothetical protein